MPTLFDPIDLNGLTLPNRMVMAPMTRTRATEDGVPTELMRDYYVQRASAGLIITECIQVSDQGHGIIRAPGLHRQDQVDGWRTVTDAVHAAGGRIYSQLWHAGRSAHSDIRGGESPVAPSAIAAEGQLYLPTGPAVYPVPRALERVEIPSIVEDFRQAAQHARDAGFDGVELHGAFGYLPDQFLQSASNIRTDDYGGSVENRARFLLEVMEALIGVWGSERVGVKLSPSNRQTGMFDTDPVATFGYVIRTLSDLGVGYLHLMEPNERDFSVGSVQIKQVAETFRSMSTVPLIANGGFDKARGNAILAAGTADLVSFGVPFLANPDLVERLRTDAPLNLPDPSTMYGEGPRGYTDYPVLEAAK